ncbi:hypothetical protein [Streptomyces sp. NPDC046925]|uniref:hypothetical protein n=1 Tax=Streptomyces sp. NPDC046925 TaxID=3155375 RepID=UPI0034089525
MADLVYKRVSTDQQSTARQDFVLAEAGMDDPRVFETAARARSLRSMCRYLTRHAVEQYTACGRASGLNRSPHTAQRRPPALDTP